MVPFPPLLIQLQLRVAFQEHIVIQRLDGKTNSHVIHELDARLISIL